MSRTLVSAFALISALATTTTVWAGSQEDARAAMDASASGDADKAIKLFTKAINAGGLPDAWLPIVYSNRGNQYWKKGDLKSDLADQNSALKLDPKFADALFRRGHVNFNLGNYRECVDDISAASAIKDGDTDDMTIRGHCYEELGDDDRAFADYDQVLHTPDKVPSAHNGMGLVLEHRGDYDAAQKEFDTAIQLNDREGMYYKNRGNNERAMEKYDAAMADYNKAIDLWPKLGGAYYGRGLVKRALGDVSGGTADMEKGRYYSRTAAADAAFVNESPEDFTRGIELTSAGKFSDAVAAFTKGAKKGDPGCQINLAVMLDAGQGTARDPDAAKKWLAKSVEDGRMFEPRAMRFNFGLYKSLAEKHYVDAQYITGRAYAEGNDGQQPTGALSEARGWLVAAAQSGSKDAVIWLGYVDRDLMRDEMKKSDAAMKAWTDAQISHLRSEQSDFMDHLKAVRRENCAAAAQGRDRQCIMD